MFHNKAAFVKEFKRKMAQMFGKAVEESSDYDRYAALAAMIRDTVNANWVETNKKYMREEREVYYFSLEFLVGKFLEQNLIYLNVLDVTREGLKDLDIELDDLINAEPEAGLGNGGLGRLAACFLDSMASMRIPGHGNGIRYRYGLFNQKLINGYQVELPDNWLREANAWEVRKLDKSVIVKFNGDVHCHMNEDGQPSFELVNYLPVRAVPYDMPIAGYKVNTVNTLRLWNAEAVDEYFDFASFSRGDYVQAVANRYSVEAISEVLYPDDSNYANRLLRLKQQYFFVSAGLQSIINRFRKKGRDLRELPDYIAVQINDTHPAVAVAELMRLLIDEHGFSWNEAWGMTKRVLSYTNHTIMPEALEKWPIDTFKGLIPRVYMIIEEIDRRLRLELTERFPNEPERVERMVILRDGMVHMAHLAVVGSHSVNGVAAVHTELLKSQVLHDFYLMYPERFNNKTNGITHRRWLLKSNPKLSALIQESIGTNWIRDPIQLRFLDKFSGDAAFIERLHAIKHENKTAFAKYVEEAAGVRIDPNAMFDVQVKRIHAYKRQLLNALRVMHIYKRLLEEPGLDIVPRVHIIAGKAAPSYYHAKTVIKFINELANIINNDKRVKDKLKLVFLENYNVGMAEKIYPASDLSEQISTASKEASGTSNMKLMMNGAVTIGTNDGANIEIREHVGDDNFILFGMSVDEVLERYSHGGYNSIEYLSKHPILGTLIEEIMSGRAIPGVPHDEFLNITRSLLDYNDEFFVLLDFDSYNEAQYRADELYRDKAKWGAMSTRNIAMSGIFSSDNTISQYASEVWHVDTRLM